MWAQIIGYTSFFKILGAAMLVLCVSRAQKIGRGRSRRKLSMGFLFLPPPPTPLTQYFCARFNSRTIKTRKQSNYSVFIDAKRLLFRLWIGSLAILASPPPPPPPPTTFPISNTQQQTQRKRILGTKYPGELGRWRWMGRRHPVRGALQTLATAVTGERRKLTRKPRRAHPSPSHSPKSLRLDHQVQRLLQSRAHWMTPYTK